LICNQGDEGGGYEPIAAGRQIGDRRWCGSRIGRLTAFRDRVVYDFAMGRTPEAITGRIRLKREEGKTALPSIKTFQLF
jgi:hypothetical protein